MSGRSRNSGLLSASIREPCRGSTRMIIHVTISRSRFLGSADYLARRRRERLGGEVMADARGLPDQTTPRTPRSEAASMAIATEKKRGFQEASSQFAVLRAKWPQAFPEKGYEVRPLARRLRENIDRGPRLEPPLRARRADGVEAPRAILLGRPPRYQAHQSRRVGERGGNRRQGARAGGSRIPSVHWVGPPSGSPARMLARASEY